MSQQVSFGELLRRYRSAAGLTQDALAERARLSTRGISDLERGVRQLPRRETVQLLADALDLAPPDRVALEAAARRGTAPTLPFVGRVRELDLLERHLAGHGPPVLLLAGEPGIGKSRLLQEAVQRAGATGWSVMQGGCQRRGGQEPYSPLLDALERRIRRVSAAQARTELAGCGWLARLLPELGELLSEPLPNWTLTPEQERRLLFGAVGRYLAGVAGPAGTLLVLDDLQWAGADALELLAALVRGTETPLRVVGAYRSTEVRPNDPLSATLADLAAARLAVQRPLAPLAPEEARELIDRLLEGTPRAAEVREQVMQRTGGVPFFVLSCAQRLRHDEDIDDGHEAVPWDVAQSVRQRVAALPDEARDLLSVAAVAGRVVPRALLTATATRPDVEVVATLEAACLARLLEEEADGYRFAHDLIREVVEGDLSGARRTLLHRRVAAALEARTGPPAVELLAYHYSRGDAPDKAALWLERAGDRAAAQAAHVAAAGYYRAAVERLDMLGRAADAAGVREKLGLSLGIAAQHEAALAALDQAAETYRALGDGQSLMRTVAMTGHVHSVRGTLDDGIGRIRPLLARFEEGEGAPPGLAALYAMLARLFFEAGRFDEQLTAAERAVELARDVADVKLRAEVAWMHGLALSCAGRFEDGTQVTEEASRLAEAIGDLFTLSYALNNLAISYGERGERARARLCAERALDVAEQLGDPALIIFMASNRGRFARITGAWAQARAFYERALAISRQIDPVYDSPKPLCELGCLCLYEGDWDGACRHLEEALAVAERIGSVLWVVQVQRALAEHDLLRGRPEAAHARVTLLLERPDLQDYDLTVDLLTMQAWAHLDLGEVARADEVAARAVTRARSWGPSTLVDPLRVQAMVATRQQRWAEAERIVEEGLGLALRLRFPYGEGRFLYVYGEMLAHKGEPEPARERLEAALAIFQRLGARKDAERTEQAIAGLLRPEHVSSG